MLQTNQIYLGDNLELLKQLDENSIHSIVSDFPYNLAFMGKQWDTISNFQEWCKVRAVECLRVLKPGGYALIFGGSRTHHRLVCGFEDAGFVIKDAIVWLYGSGFPKSYDISKGFDKQAGAERKIVAENPNSRPNKFDDLVYQAGIREKTSYLTEPSTDLAKQWDGWGTALKPAFEYIMVAQKPYENTYCYNVEKYGVGGLNIDDSRIALLNPETHKTVAKSGLGNNVYGVYANDKDYTTKGELLRYNSDGRFPANIIFDEEAARLLDEQSGTLTSGKVKPEGFKGDYTANVYGKYANNLINPETVYGDSGGASRFFYCAKSSKKDRTENGQVDNNHPTVKPTDLIKHLVKLATPPNGICLDICEGSGTHAKACIILTQEGYPVEYIGFENDEHSFEIAQQRIAVNKSRI